MGYRNEDKGRELRLEQLEDDLASAKDTIARLEGDHFDEADSDVAAVLNDEYVKFERVLDVEASDEAIEGVAGAFMGRFTGGHVNEVGRTLTCSFGNGTMKLVRRKGKTRIRLSLKDPRSRILEWLGGLGFAALFGPMLGGALFALGMPSQAGFVLAPVCLFGGYLLMREAMKRDVARRRKDWLGMLALVTRLADKHGVAEAQAQADRLS